MKIFLIIIVSILFVSCGTYEDVKDFREQCHTDGGVVKKKDNQLICVYGENNNGENISNY